MKRRLAIVGTGVISLLGAIVVPASSSSAATILSVRSQVPMSLSTSLPLVRLHFSAPTNASSLPPLVVNPPLRTTWQQIGPDAVQAVVTSKLKPSVPYSIATPVQMRCSSTCVFSKLRTHVASVSTSVTWEDQLLAELNYLPVTFISSATQNDPTQPASGQFVWKYANLPTILSSQWRVGTDNAIVNGALMNFQSVNNLPTTGVADALTWSTLINAVAAKKLDPASYNFVHVTMGTPESLTLYVGGQTKFHTLVNTGISVSPTATGTYPVYLRYVSQTMSGTNPDGSHYSDPGIPWVSYFNGGDALHGFIRATYGWPQSLGCVEMPFASAKVVFPYTPIGTLVTVS